MDPTWLYTLMILKAAGGILSFEGDILFNKLSIKKNPVDYRRVVNFAEAEPIFPEFITGIEMIKLFTSAKGTPKGQVEYLVESMGIGHYIHEPIGSYSTGMIKKLSLVLAFIGNPELVLLDEPFITMDSESLNVLYDWISKKNQDGVSFIFSSHQTIEPKVSFSQKALLVEEQTLKSIS
jgi:ABC-2 type transport system ATP-binding protein